MKKELHKVGLSTKEIAVYLALLELGQTTIARIAQRSKVQRTTVYDVINDLKLKGLVGKTITKSKKYYFAEDPRNLEHILKEKQTALTRVMPELLAITNFLDQKPKVRFYESINGIKEVYYDTLQYPDNHIDIWYADDIHEELDEHFFYEEYIPKRVKKHISVRALAPQSEVMKRFHINDVKHLRRMKFIKSDSYEMHAYFMLYGSSKVAIMSYEEQSAVVIESPMIHKSLRSIFAFMWDILPD